MSLTHGNSPASHTASRCAKARRWLALGFKAEAVASECNLPLARVRELLAELRASRVPGRKQLDGRRSAIEQLKAEGFTAERIAAVFGN